MRYYTIQATNESGNSLKTCIGAESEEQAIKLFLDEYGYENSHWVFTEKEIDWVRPSKRYTYSIVGMGIFSLLGKIYEGGRIEINDRKNDSGYPINEASYFIAKSDFEPFYKFFKDLETDYPIQLSFGSIEECQRAVSEKLDIPVDKLKDKETIKKFYYKEYQDYLKALDPKERQRLKQKFGE